MLVKIFVNSNVEGLENNINSFIGTRKIIDIKYMIMDGAVYGSSRYSALVMYDA